MNLADKKILVTGGLGFIGFNAVCHFAKNNQIHIVDDWSRIGVEAHLPQLKKMGVGFSRVDISHFKEFREVFFSFKPDIVIHMAAQVAVTASIKNPVRDFRSNLQGSINLLELARHSQKKPIILYASTNKVYGNINNEVFLKNGRYTLKNPYGFSEATTLSFETPYGCSKGAAEQYFIDYYRSYHIPSVIFRQSCIYGPFQFGMEDQGWLAWFVICSLFNKTITIFGDGNQVRDVLYIDDLLDLYEKSIIDIDKVKGEVFNIGGGPDFTLSLKELIEILEGKNKKEIPIVFDDWRLGDQKVYISDIRKAEQLLGWRPKVSPQEGVHRLIEWMRKEKALIFDIYEKQQALKRRCDVSVVIPARNEESNLGTVLDEVDIFMSSSPFSYEVIVVDDRSTDKTAAVAKRYPFVKLIKNGNPPGKGGALRSGFEIAQGKYIAMMDADFSHDASDLPLMIEEVKRHQGLVIGSRITGGSQEYTRVRAFGNIILTWLFGFVHGRYLSDALNGFKVFHRDIYTEFEYSSSGYEIEIELLVNTLRLNRPITEIPSRERARLSGKAKSLVIKDGTRFSFRIIKERFRKAVRRERKSALVGNSLSELLTKEQVIAELPSDVKH